MKYFKCLAHRRYPPILLTKMLGKCLPIEQIGTNAGPSYLSCTSHSSSCSAPSSECFPANATVQLQSGTTKSMSQLEVGDHVLVDANTYSEVYMFSHRYADFSGPFVAIQTASGEELMLTADHYLLVHQRQTRCGQHGQNRRHCLQGGWN